MRAQAIPVRATVQRRPRGDEWFLAAGLAMLAVAVLAVGLLYLRLASSVATGGYDVLKLENERSRWQIANQQLSYKAAQLSSLVRVEQVARETLKMAPTKETLYLRARVR